MLTKNEPINPLNVQRVHSMAKMLNGTNSWIAFDTSPLVGGIYYKYYLMKAIQAPVSLPITAVTHIGWVTIDGSHSRKYTSPAFITDKERVFIDLANRIYSPKYKKYLTILEAGIMIDPTLTRKLNLNYELLDGFPRLPPAIGNLKQTTIDGQPGLKALGRYIYYYITLNPSTTENIYIQTV